MTRIGMLENSTIYSGAMSISLAYLYANPMFVELIDNFVKKKGGVTLACNDIE